jgi:hypothetical protein
MPLKQNVGLSRYLQTVSSKYRPYNDHRLLWELMVHPVICYLPVLTVVCHFSEESGLLVKDGGAECVHKTGK